MSNGYVYAAIGEEYIQLAARSIMSLRKYSNLPVEVFTCSEQARYSILKELPNVTEVNLYDDFIADFDLYLDHANHIISRKLKVMSAIRNSFDKWLFIDTDTLIKGRIDSFFDFNLIQHFLYVNSLN